MIDHFTVFFYKLYYKVNPTYFILKFKCFTHICIIQNALSSYKLQKISCIKSAFVRILAEFQANLKASVTNYLT